MKSQISYADATRILGIADSPALQTVDRVLGVAIIGVAAATQKPELLALLHARDELVAQTQKLLSGLRQRVRGAHGRSRTELLVAAHTIVAINAYFEALREIDNLAEPSQTPKAKKLRLTRSDQLNIAGAPEDTSPRKLVEVLLDTAFPLPAAHLPYEGVLAAMKDKYKEMSSHIMDFVTGLSQWDELNDTQRQRLRTAIRNRIPERSVEQYDCDLRRLAIDCPEFQMWMYLADSAATRMNVEKGFDELRQMLQSLVGSSTSGEWSTRLARVYSAELNRSITDTSPSEAYAGLSIPLLREAYVVPSFRVAEYSVHARPAEESWWSAILPREDIAHFLAGHLTSPVAIDTPLVILGHPGSGKSLFTKMLAASLPAEEYLPIRVELRRSPADASIQTQIEAALRDSIHERVEWSDVMATAGETLPVVMLDGFDELLQISGVSQSDYLKEVQDFQRREADQGRRVAMVVTSRIVSADRVRFPLGTVVAKLEAFDEKEVGQWLTSWNEVNCAYFEQHDLQQLPLQSLRPHWELATQPLLLLMLALYDADGNVLQNATSGLLRAELYERLLVKFVGREIEKLFRNLDDGAQRDLAAMELRQLSILALGMFNRGRKALSRDDLNGDMAAFLSANSADVERTSKFDPALGRIELLVERFFFIYKCQAIVDDAQLREYEFLHSTFGEYLSARAIYLSLDRMLRVTAVEGGSLDIAPTSHTLDDELWSLLSFSSLMDGSQIGTFLAERAQVLNDDQRAKISNLLLVLFRRGLRPRQNGYEGYAPRQLDVPARHAVYSANLLLLVLLVGRGSISVSELFGDRDGAMRSWGSVALLWRSQLRQDEWIGLVKALSVRHVTGDVAMDMEVTLATENSALMAKAWFGAGALRLPEGASGAYDPDLVGRQISLLCVPEMDLLMHAIEGLMHRDAKMLTELIRNPDGTARSIMSQSVGELWSQIVDRADAIRLREGRLDQSSS